MGATNIEFELPGKSTRTDIEQAFKRQREHDSHTNGHQEGYSGDFQTVNRVDIHDMTFNSYSEAENYCLENARKWQTVVAVRYKVTDKVKLDSKAKKLQVMRTKLQTKLTELNTRYFRTLETKLKSTEFVTDRHGCKSKLAGKYLLQMDVIRCPVCQGSLLSTAQQTKRKFLQGKLKEIESEICTHNDTLQKQAVAKSKETQWLVCGWGAC